MIYRSKLHFRFLKKIAAILGVLLFAGLSWAEDTVYISNDSSGILYRYTGSATEISDILLDLSNITDSGININVGSTIDATDTLIISDTGSITFNNTWNFNGPIHNYGNFAIGYSNETNVGGELHCYEGSTTSLQAYPNHVNLTAPLIIDENASLTTGSSYLNSTSTIANNGTITTGFLISSGSIVNNGTFTVSFTTTINGTVLNNGAFSNGQTSNNGNITNSASGSFNGGDFTNNAGAVVTNNGNYTTYGLTNLGSFTNSSGSSLSTTIITNGNSSGDTAVFVNAGSLSSDNVTNNEGASFTNTSTGFFDTTWPTQNGGSFVNDGSVTGEINNSGSGTTTGSGGAVTSDCIWRGTANTDWSNPLNWSTGTVPDSSTEVLIPLASNVPVLTSNSSVRILNLVSGASIDTGTYTLSVSGTAEIDGTINGSGSLSATTINAGGTINVPVTSTTFVTKAVATVNAELISNTVTIKNGTDLIIDNGSGNALTVTGNVGVTGGLFITGNLNVGGSISVNGRTFAHHSGNVVNAVITFWGNFTQTFTPTATPDQKYSIYSTKEGGSLNIVTNPLNCTLFSDANKVTAFHFNTPATFDSNPAFKNTGNIYLGENCSKFCLSSGDGTISFSGNLIVDSTDFTAYSDFIISGNFTDNGKIISDGIHGVITLNGNGIQTFAQSSASVYKKITIQKTIPKDVTFGSDSLNVETLNFVNNGTAGSYGTTVLPCSINTNSITAAVDAGNIIFSGDIAIAGNSTFNNTETVTFGSGINVLASDSGTTYYDIIHTAGPTIIGGNIKGNNLTFSNISLTDDSVLDATNGVLSFEGSVTSNGNKLTVKSNNATGILFYNGPSFADAAALTISGNSTIYGTNTFTELTAQAGIIRLPGTNQVNGLLTVNSGSTIEVNNFKVTDATTNEGTITTGTSDTTFAAYSGSGTFNGNTGKVTFTDSFITSGSFIASSGITEFKKSVDFASASNFSYYGGTSGTIYFFNASGAAQINFTTKSGQSIDKLYFGGNVNIILNGSCTFNTLEMNNISGSAEYYQSQSFTSQISGTGSASLANTFLMNRVSTTAGVTGSLNITSQITAVPVIETHSGVNLTVGTGNSVTCTILKHVASETTPNSTLNVKGTLNLTIFDQAFSTGAIAVNVAASGTINTETYKSTNPGNYENYGSTVPVSNQGTITISSNGSFSLPSSWTVNNSGIIQTNGDGSISGTFNGTGTIKATGGNVNISILAASTQDKILCSNGNLTLSGPEKITCKNFSVENGNFTAASNSALVCSTAFSAATNMGGKTITLNNNVTVNGTLTLAGTSGNLLNLTADSTAHGFIFNANKSGGSYISVDDNITVKNSTGKTAGFYYTATNSQAASGTDDINTALVIRHGWLVKDPSELTYTWTGNNSTEWNLAENWDLTLIPVSGAKVIIPDSPAGSRFPVLTTGTYSAGTISIGSTISSPATITLGTKNLVLSEISPVINYGTIIYSGTGRIADISGTVLNDSSATHKGTVEYKTATGIIGNVSYWNLIISSGTWTSASPLTVSNALSVTNGTFKATDVITEIGENFSILNGTVNASKAITVIGGDLIVTDSNVTVSNVNVTGNLLLSTVSTNTTSLNSGNGKITVSGLSGITAEANLASDALTLSGNYSADNGLKINRGILNLKGHVTADTRLNDGITLNVVNVNATTASAITGNMISGVSSGTVTVKGNRLEVGGSVAVISGTTLYLQNEISNSGGFTNNGTVKPFETSATAIISGSGLFTNALTGTISNTSECTLTINSDFTDSGTINEKVTLLFAGSENQSFTNRTDITYKNLKVNKSDNTLTVENTLKVENLAITDGNVIFNDNLTVTNGDGEGHSGIYFTTDDTITLTAGSITSDSISIINGTLVAKGTVLAANGALPPDYGAIAIHEVLATGDLTIQGASIRISGNVTPDTANTYDLNLIAETGSIVVYSDSAIVIGNSGNRFHNITISAINEDITFAETVTVNVSDTIIVNGKSVSFDGAVVAATLHVSADTLISVNGIEVDNSFVVTRNLPTTEVRLAGLIYIKSGDFLIDYPAYLTNNTTFKITSGKLTIDGTGSNSGSIYSYNNISRTLKINTYTTSELKGSFDGKTSVAIITTANIYGSNAFTDFTVDSTPADKASSGATWAKFQDNTDQTVNGKLTTSGTGEIIIADNSSLNVAGTSTSNGTITLGISSTANFGNTFSNGGTLNLNSGDVLFSSDLKNNGTVTAADGIITINGNYRTDAGKSAVFTAPSSETVIKGNADFSKTTLYANNGLIKFAGASAKTVTVRTDGTNSFNNIQLQNPKGTKISGGNFTVTNVIIDSGASLELSGTITAEITNDWTNNSGSSAFIPGTSTVKFTARDSSTRITNSNKWYNLEFNTTSISAAVSVTFDAGKYQTVQNKLIAKGNSTANTVTLQPETAGNYWYLVYSGKANINETSDFKYAVLDYCNSVNTEGSSTASDLDLFSKAEYVSDSSASSFTTKNCFTAPYYWTGNAGSTDWTTNSNWSFTSAVPYIPADSGTYPDYTSGNSKIIILSDLPVYPEIPADTTLRTLTLYSKLTSENAEIQLAGFGLSVKEQFVNNGTVHVHGNQLAAEPCKIILPSAAGKVTENGTWCFSNSALIKPIANLTYKNVRAEGNVNIESFSASLFEINGSSDVTVTNSATTVITAPVKVSTNGTFTPSALLTITGNISGSGNFTVTGPVKLGGTSVQAGSIVLQGNTESTGTSISFTGPVSIGKAGKGELTSFISAGNQTYNGTLTILSQSKLSAKTDGSGIITFKQNVTFNNDVEFSGTVSITAGKKIVTSDAIRTAVFSKGFAANTSVIITGNAKIYNSNSFSSLTVDNSSLNAITTVAFEKGKTQSIKAIQTKGYSPTNYLLLDSTDPTDTETLWNVYFSSPIPKDAKETTPDFSFTKVNLSHSVTSTGTDNELLFIQTNNTLSEKNPAAPTCKCWFTYKAYWLGTYNNQWSNPQNWSYTSDGAFPYLVEPDKENGISDIIIYAGASDSSAPYILTLNSDSTESVNIKSLTVESGITADFCTASLTAKTATNKGRLRFAGHNNTNTSAQVIKINGVDVASVPSANLVNAANSTIEYYDSIYGTKVPWGNRYENLEFTNSASGTISNTSFIVNGNTLIINDESESLSLPNASNQFENTIQIGDYSASPEIYAGNITLSGTKITLKAHVFCNSLTLNSASTINGNISTKDGQLYKNNLSFVSDDVLLLNQNNMIELNGAGNINIQSSTTPSTAKIKISGVVKSMSPVSILTGTLIIPAGSEIRAHANLTDSGNLKIEKNGILYGIESSTITIDKDLTLDSGTDISTQGSLKTGTVTIINSDPDPTKIKARNFSATGNISVEQDNQDLIIQSDGSTESTNFITLGKNTGSTEKPFNNLYIFATTNPSVPESGIFGSFTSSGKMYAQNLTVICDSLSLSDDNFSGTVDITAKTLISMAGLKASTLNIHNDNLTVVPAVNIEKTLELENSLVIDYPVTLTNSTDFKITNGSLTFTDRILPEASGSINSKAPLKCNLSIDAASGIFISDSLSTVSNRKFGENAALGTVKIKSPVTLSSDFSITADKTEILSVNITGSTLPAPENLYIKGALETSGSVTVDPAVTVTGNYTNAESTVSEFNRGVHISGNTTLEANSIATFNNQTTIQGDILIKNTSSLENNSVLYSGGNFTDYGTYLPAVTDGSISDKGLLIFNSDEDQLFTNNNSTHYNLVESQKKSGVLTVSSDLFTCFSYDSFSNLPANSTSSNCINSEFVADSFISLGNVTVKSDRTITAPDLYLNGNLSTDSSLKFAATVTTANNIQLTGNKIFNFTLPVSAGNNFKASADSILFADTFEASGKVKFIANVYLYGTGSGSSDNFTSTSDSINISGNFIVARNNDSAIIAIGNKLTADNIVLYSGTLAPEANSHIKAIKDMVLLGAAYDDSTSADNRSYSQTNYTLESAFPVPSIIWPADKNGAITAGASATLETTNFYANGIFLHDDGTNSVWYVNVPDLRDSSNGFAEAYNVDVDYSVVRCSADNSTDGSKACIPAYNSDVDENSKNWDYEDFVILKAYTVYDNVVYVEFSRAIRNQHGEINGKPAAGISSVATPLISKIQYKGNNGSYTSFTGIFNDENCESEISGNITKNSLNEYGIYLQAPASDPWNTDATGKSSGNSDELSTDHNGIHRHAIPVVKIPDSILNIWGKRLSDKGIRPDGGSGNYENSPYSNVTDHTGAVLYSVRTGQENHKIYNSITGASSQDSQDSHNFIEFRYSEPINAGISTDPAIWLPAFAADGGTGSTENASTDFVEIQNIQVTDDFGALKNMSSKSESLEFTGIAKLESGIVYTGTNGSISKYANALYRTDAYSLRISVAGYTDGTVNYLGNEYKNWNSYIEKAELPSGKVSQPSFPNSYITDCAVDFTDISKPALLNKQNKATDEIFTVNNDFSNPAKVAAGTDLYKTYGIWDIQSPVFCKARMAGDSAYEYYCEAIGTGPTTYLDFVEIHILDNPSTDTEAADSYNWFSKVGWTTDMTGETSNLVKIKDSMADARTADTFGGSRPFEADEYRTTGGLRMSTTVNQQNLFKYVLAEGEEDNSIPVNNFTSTGTGVSASFFLGDYDIPNPLPVDADIPYITLYLTGSTYAIDDTMNISYNYNSSFITDLAGNRLQPLESTEANPHGYIKTIDRTPPEYYISLGPVASKEMYITISKNITHKNGLRFNDTRITQEQYLKILPYCFELCDHSGRPYSETDELQIERSIPFSIVEEKTNRYYTTFKISLTKEITLEDVIKSYIRAILPPHHIYPELIPENYKTRDPITSNYDFVTLIQDNIGNHIKLYAAHPLSDFAIDAIKVNYAYNNNADLGFDNDEEFDFSTGLYNKGEWAVHDFSAEQKNYGTLSYGSGINFAVTADQYILDNSLGLQAYFAEKPAADSISSVYNKNLTDSLRIWLPVPFESISETPAVPDFTIPGKTDSRKDAEANSLLFSLSKEQTATWTAGSQISFLFGFDSVNIKHFPVLDLSASTYEPGQTFGNYSGDESPLYLLRLKTATDITSIDLWSFITKNSTKQRGGVSILNNVINPVNGEKTIIQIDNPSEGNVSIIVMTLDGNVISYLNRGNLSKGNHMFTWDGKTKNGRNVSRGLYFVRILGNGMDETRKVLVVK